MEKTHIEMMKNDIIREFGFEDYRTIAFFEVCEVASYETICYAYYYAYRAEEEEV